MRISLVGLALMATLAVTELAAAQGSGKNRKEAEGLSAPYMQAVAKGEGAYAARDFPAAVVSFQDAIKLDGQQMLGFYRLGEAQLAAGKPDEADAAWQSALRKKGTDALQAKVLLVIADLRERQAKYDAAKEAWNAYTAFVQSHPKAAGFANTATERQKMIDRRVKDLKDYAAVKERISKRESEKFKEAEDNAKKDKLNK